MLVLYYYYYDHYYCYYYYYCYYHYYYYYYYYYYSTLYYKFTYKGKKAITKAANEIVKKNTKMTRLSLPSKLSLSLSRRKKDIGNKEKKRHKA